MTWLQYGHAREWPPFPAVSVMITDLLGQRGVNVCAKIDTGSFMTIVPCLIIEYLEADRTIEGMKCWGYDGHESRLSGFLVNIYVTHPQWPSDVPRAFEGIDVLAVDAEAAAHTEGLKATAEVLLGRDVLAAWYLHLDGPNSRYRVVT